MARSNSTPYSLFTPTSYWTGAGAKPFANVQFGLDTSTGKRDSQRMADLLTEQPFATGFEPIQFTAPPGYGVAEDMNADLYESLADRLAKKSLALEAKQQLLGLGSGLAFSAASLPFVERLRNVDYQLGLQADINSPSRQAERNRLAQEQASSASSAISDRLRALAAVRQAASSGFNLNA